MRGIKILLVDDHRMFLEGLSSIFLDVDEICVLDSLTDGKQAVDYLSSHQVDVVVTDINMPEMDGIALNLEIKKKWPSTKTLVLSTHSDPETIQKAIRADADGYLLKNAEKDELISGIREVHLGNKFYSKEVQQKLTDSMFSNQGKTKSIPILSKRENEILKLIADEFTAQQIAEKLFISQHTVNSHRKNLLSKLGVKNTAGLIKYALVNGLIQ
ncbi:MAG: response regulator transcription factor [Reichenbachiella sp.]